MLQPQEIQQRFTHIRQTIGEAEKACMKSNDTPPELRDVIQRLARESEQASKVIQSNDETRIIQCVDDLEDLGDEAKRVSRSAANISPNVESAVTKVHAELSELKHKLH